MTVSHHLQRNPSLVGAEMDSEFIMLDVEGGSYFALNAVGSHIWEALEQPMTQDTLVASVLRTFEASDPGRVAQDVASFVTHLLDKGLVHPVDG